MMDDYSSLLRKLEGLGVKAGSAIPNTTEGKDTVKHLAIEDIIDGHYEKTHFGDTFTVTTRYPYPYSHGQVPLTPPSSFQSIWKWAKFSDASLPDIRNICFLDTETSGLAGGTGTFIFMVGFGAFDSQGFSVTQLFMRDPSEEQAFLATLGRLTARYSSVVTYNGKSFDIPMLRSRHIQNHFPFEMSDWHHIDLLHLVRQIWKYSQESRTLKDMEGNILNFQRDQEEVPGWLVPQLYFDYLQNRDPRPLVGVFYHNAIDIVSLAALFSASAQLMECPFDPIPIPKKEVDLIALARIHENMSSLQLAASLYAEGIKSGLPVELELSAIMRFAEFCKRKNNYDEAIILWKKAVNLGSIDACVELAKYYEHHCGDVSLASHYTETALTFLPSVPLFSIRKQRTEIIHRQGRLLKKMNIPMNIAPGEPHGES